MKWIVKEICQAVRGEVEFHHLDGTVSIVPVDLSHIGYLDVCSACGKSTSDPPTIASDLSQAAKWACRENNERKPCNFCGAVPEVVDDVRPSDPGPEGFHRQYGRTTGLAGAQ